MSLARAQIKLTQKDAGPLGGLSRPWSDLAYWLAQAKALEALACDLVHARRHLAGRQAEQDRINDSILALAHYLLENTLVIWRSSYPDDTIGDAASRIIGADPDLAQGCQEACFLLSEAVDRARGALSMVAAEAGFAAPSVTLQ